MLRWRRIGGPMRLSLRGMVRDLRSVLYRESIRGREVDEEEAERNLYILGRHARLRKMWNMSVGEMSKLTVLDLVPL